MGSVPSAPPSAERVSVEPLVPAEIERLLTRAVVRGMRALFADYGVSAETSGDKPVRPGTFPEMWARIDFDGPGIRGHVILGAAIAPLRRSRPGAGGERDWLSELINQLMGRVKNEMVRSGVQLQQGLPAIIPAEARGADGANLLQWIFAADGGVISVGIEATIDHAVIPDPELLNWDVPPEGELLLF